MVIMLLYSREKYNIENKYQYQYRYIVIEKIKGEIVYGIFSGSIDECYT